MTREYIKSQIDLLPEELLAKVGKIISKKLEDSEKAKRNAEYLARLDRADKNIKEGRCITFEWEEFEAMTKMPIEEAKKFATARAAENGVSICL